MRWRTCIAIALTSLLVVAGLATAQQQYGTLTGTVSDASGGIVPGATVTITSSALIGGSQTQVAGGTGAYAFRSLPPGEYSATYELAGFSTLTQEGVVIAVARVTTVNVALTVGAVAETITVTGESPVVDVRQNITSTNIDADIYENIPTARNPWEMAGLVPGMITGQVDVGGNRGMQQYQLEVMGSANSQKSFSIDGLKVNWPGGSGGWTMQYYDFGMFEEYNFQTSAMTAESDVAGVYMNMVTKSGGNEVSGNQSVFFNNDAMQGTNTPEDSSLGGNPTELAYDLQGTIGGPIAQDKAWFFASGRWWRVDQFLPGTLGLGEGGGQVIDDNRITNFMAKTTYQINDNTKFFVMFNKNWKYRFHRNLSGQPFAEIAATSFQKQPAHNLVLSYNSLIGDKALLDVRFGRMWGETPYYYNEAVTSDTIAFADTGLGQGLRAAQNEYINPNHRNQFNANLSIFADTGGGAHDLKVGVQIGRERFQTRRTVNQGINLRAIDGVGDEAILFDTPVQSDNRLNTWGAYVNDSWTIGRKLTLNLGVRFDGIKGTVPAQTSPAGPWTGERSFTALAQNVPHWGGNVAPRLGLAYDIRGDGRTAIKVYYGRSYIQTGSQFTQGVNPVSGNSSTVPWNDLDGDLFLATGPSGGYTDSPELDLTRFLAEGFVGGASTRFDPGTNRPYSDLFDFGLEHQLTADVAVSVHYVYRTHRDGIARVDANRPTSAYSPMSVTYDDPVDGPSTVTAYNIDPAFIGARDRVIQNVDVLQSNYNGMSFDVRRRMSNNWSLLGGLTVGSHKGFDQSDGYYTGVDFNNPNTQVNRDDGSVFTDLPWILTVSGAYNFPKNIMLSVNYRGRAGHPENRTLRVTGLNQGSETLRVAQRGTDRADAFTNFLNLSVRKRISVGDTAFVEPIAELYNIFNADTVHRFRDRIGSSYGNPTRLLAPITFRLGLKWVF